MTPRAVTRNNSPSIEIDGVDELNEETPRRSTIHFGSTYKNDIKILWKILQSSLINKHPYNHIVSFETSKDVRKAYISLKDFYEGEDFIQRTQDTAMMTLTNTFYRGDTRYFKFEDYVNVHMNAHEMLKQIEYNFGNGLDNTTKIHYFRNNIRPEAVLDTSISLGRQQEDNGFISFVNLLLTEIDFKNSRRRQVSKQSQHQRIANVKHSKPNGYGFKRNNSDTTHQPMLTKIVEGKRLESSIYPPAEYRKLSERQKKVFRELNSERKRMTRKGEKSNPRVSRITRSDLNNISTAIVSGIKKSQNNTQAEDVLLDDSPTPSKYKASSGELGEFLRNEKRRLK